jgi:hypothetical protein
MDDRDIKVPGARPVQRVLASDPFFRAFGQRLTQPWVLGCIIALLVILVIIFGPSTDSRFIYTDF